MDQSCCYLKDSWNQWLRLETKTTTLPRCLKPEPEAQTAVSRWLEVIVLTSLVNNWLKTEKIIFVSFLKTKTKTKGDCLISSINTEAALQSDISDICKF